MIRLGILLQLGGDVDGLGNQLAGAKGFALKDLPRVNADADGKRCGESVLLLIKRS